MTDNEIIKALDCCLGRNGWGDPKCYECPFDGSNPNIGCKKNLLNNALDLINRQKVEIEGLEAEIDKQYEQAKADILGNISDGGTSCHWCMDEHRKIAKAEAIKEFAERLKEKIGIGTTWDWVFEDIEETVKEMTGEQK